MIDELENRGYNGTENLKPFPNGFRRLTIRQRLTENDIEEMLREVRLSLLEADVNYKVVKEFTDEIRELALGEKILKGLNPGQQVVKIVNDELKKLMGSDAADLILADKGLTTVMLVGLQGTGKTTTAGKLAGFIEKPSEETVARRSRHLPSGRDRTTPKQSEPN